jgi:AmmeMemoRadiSam system protein B
MIKPPNVAGQFYSADPVELARDIGSYLDQAKVGKVFRQPRAIIVPHAGHIYSGSVAAWAFKAAAAFDYRTVMVSAPTHYYRFEGVSVWPEGGFRTPLGVIRADEGFCRELIAAHPKAGFFGEVYEREHSLEVELPFIQSILPGARLAAMINGREFDAVFVDEWVEILDRLIGDRDDVLFVVSTDMSHFHDDATARRLDAAACQAVLALDAELIRRDNHKIMEIDGVFEVLTLIKLARKRGWQPRLLCYANSGEVSGDKSNVVGYAAMMFTDKDGGVRDDKPAGPNEGSRPL